MGRQEVLQESRGESRVSQEGFLEEAGLHMQMSKLSCAVEM